MKKIAIILAVALMAAPTLSHAAMNAANTVNSAAIVDGSIATADIANAAVTGAKIASGTITSANIGANAITATAIAAGAVTDTKISGTISVGKLPVGTTATTVAAGNHTHASGVVNYAQVIVVAKSGGNFTSPVQALAAITDASASKPYLVKVMPGVYDLGSVSLKMKPHVHLEGSGEASVIKSSSQNTVPGTSKCGNATVDMADNSSAKNVRIENYALGAGGTDYGTTFGVAFDGTTLPVNAVLDSVSVLAGSDNANASHTAAVCTGGALVNATLRNVSLEARSSARAIALVNSNSANTTIINSKLVSTSLDTTYSIDCCNMFNDSITGINGTVIVLNSQLDTSAPNANIDDPNTCKEFKIANSKICGASAEGVKLFNNFDCNFDPIPNQ